jgi:hypothetical protein
MRLNQSIVCCLIVVLFSVRVEGSVKRTFRPAKLAQVGGPDRSASANDAEFDHILTARRLDVFREMKDLSNEIVSGRTYSDPESFVKGLLKYSLYLTTLFNRIYSDADGAFLAREAGANILPDFLLEAMDVFRIRLAEAVRDHGKPQTRSLVKSEAGQKMLNYNPEDVLCLRALLTTNPRFVCYRHSVNNICEKFRPYEVVIQRFLVSYSLVKRLSDVIHAAYYVYTHDGSEQSYFAGAIDGDITDFSDERLPSIRDFLI